MIFGQQVRLLVGLRQGGIDLLGLICGEFRITAARVLIQSLGDSVTNDPVSVGGLELIKGTEYPIKALLQTVDDYGAPQTAV